MKPGAKTVLRLPSHQRRRAGLSLSLSLRLETNSSLQDSSFQQVRVRASLVALSIVLNALHFIAHPRS
jgi:hypothetical protein